MLPAVGREDIHVAQESWPIRPQACEGHHSTNQVIQEIVDAAKVTKVVVINEAHDRPRHRDFVRQVAVALRPLGYTHFAAETFADSLSSGEQSKYPLMEYGYYSNEPAFGALLRELKTRGFKLVPYEYRSDSGAAELDTHTRASIREEGQADNLKRVVDSLAEGERLIAHVGYSHASEVPIRSFGGKDLAWMASRLKEKTGIDPLTIDQTDCSIEYGPPSRTKPSVKHHPGQFDIVVGHPDLTFSDGRPAWRQRGNVGPVAVPVDYRSDRERVIVEVRPVGEPPGSVPVDRLMLWVGNDLPLLLPSGVYSLTSYFEDSKRVVAGTITVMNE